MDSDIGLGSLGIFEIGFWRVSGGPDRMVDNQRCLLETGSQELTVDLGSGEDNNFLISIGYGSQAIRRFEYTNLVACNLGRGRWQILCSGAQASPKIMNKQTQQYLLATCSQ